MNNTNSLQGVTWFIFTALRMRQVPKFSLRGLVASWPYRQTSRFRSATTGGRVLNTFHTRRASWWRWTNSKATCFRL